MIFKLIKKNPWINNLNNILKNHKITLIRMKNSFILKMIKNNNIQI